MTVYADGTAVLNFLTDYLLLWGTGALTGRRRGSLRLCLGAVLGGLYGALCLAPGFRFLGGLGWRVLFLGLMLALAFGLGRQLIRQGILFLTLTLALGGGGYLLRQGGSLSFLSLGAGAGALALGCRILGRTGTGTVERVDLTLSLGGRQVRVTALRDTGNGLKDPLTGQAVTVIGPGAAKKLLPGLDRAALADPASAMENLLRQAPGLRLRLIPYGTVGREGGLLLGLRCDRVTAGKERLGKLIAISPTELSENGSYEALTGGI